MDISGCRVLHKKWGEGAIIGCTENTVTVRFNTKSASNDNAKVDFIFPDAFSNGFLQGADVESKWMIKTAINELKCSSCGRETVRTEIIDDRRLCTRCKSSRVKNCDICRKEHIDNLMHSLRDPDHPFLTIRVCQWCWDNQTFSCEQCGFRYPNEYRAPNNPNGKVLCSDCYDRVAIKCFYCGSLSYKYEGEFFDDGPNEIFVCANCLDSHTFICSNCGERRLNSDLADSRYVPAKKSVCNNCTYSCMACNCEIDFDSAIESFSSHYCPDCWKSKRHKCTICGEEYIPENNSQKTCPDCVEMLAYVKRLSTTDTHSFTFKEFSYYGLENINRCTLFTNIYDTFNTRSRANYPVSPKEMIDFVVLDLYEYRIVVTYLPYNIIGKCKYSTDLTMTYFRSKKGRLLVYRTIKNWLMSSSHFLETPAGKMQIINYPIRLRVQTEHDKVYGKEWNGPYDYIEIGNYGDTTSFHIIGILEK